MSSKEAVSVSLIITGAVFGAIALGIRYGGRKMEMEQTLNSESSHHFECTNCHMTMTFPFYHEMVSKLEGTYWVQDQWFCCETCLDTVYDPQALALRRLSDVK